jgi:two-component system, OmpR family, response regulator
MDRYHSSMMGPAARVLVVEDDAAVRHTVRIALENEGHQIRAEGDGLAVEAVTRDFRPDVAVLDVRLPTGPCGLSIAAMLRGIDGDLPIIFLTAADDVEDRLAGFRVGGDDYLTKPFAVAELQARVHALLRRSGRLRTTGVWEVDDLCVDEGARRATRNGRELDLTRTEFELLAALGANADRVLSKSQLLTSVWGFEEYDPNVVEVYVSSLRRKLESEGEPRLVQTVRGVGYVLRA